MFGTKAAGTFVTGGGSRAGAWAILAFWCLLSIVSSATRAHCLELGKGCQPTSAGVAAPCHERTPPGEPDPLCGSCVDVVVPEVASASCSRHDVEFEATAAAPPAGAPQFALAEHSPASGAAQRRLNSPHSPLRTTVLLI